MAPRTSDKIGGLRSRARTLATTAVASVVGAAMGCFGLQGVTSSAWASPGVPAALSAVTASTVPPASCAGPDGEGYWQVASDGGVFTFGTAGFYGSTGAIRL